MWSPRRLLIFVGAFALFLGGYIGYAYFLGGIDGLPPLPADYYPPAAGQEMQIVIPPEAEVERKMRLAFGADCEEVKRNHKLDLRSKGWVIAAEKFDFLSDGRVTLKPFSAAVFAKSNNGAVGEINIVQCEEAILTLDRPVTAALELQNRKVIGIELRSQAGITVISNRGTLEKNDDIELLITGGPLFFDERRSLIWTEGFVKLVDKQSRPHPTQVTAKGLDIQLARKAAQPKSKDKKDDDSNFIDLLVLRANVEMHVWVDPASGFLASADKAAPPKTTEEKSQLIIKTPGTFTYHVAKDLATFDSPTRAGAEGEVQVSREHQTAAGKTYDQLVCDQLTLQFRRKPMVASPQGSRGPEKAKEIEFAQATARPGKEVVLTMDSEELEAYGRELTFFAASEHEPAKTVLKGLPMHAVKNGHMIEAVELHLISEKSGGNRVCASGAGRIDLYDKAKGKHALHATWKKGLTSTKERDGDKVLDVLTLTGDAGFIDDEHSQELRGERLIVWLDTPAKDDDSPASRERKRPEEPATVISRQKPLKIEAYENVRAESADFRVVRCEHLEIRFLKEGVPGERLPTIGAVDATGLSRGVSRWFLQQPALFADATGFSRGDSRLPSDRVKNVTIHGTSPWHFEDEDDVCRNKRKHPRDEPVAFNPSAPILAPLVSLRFSHYSPQLASPASAKKRSPIELEARRIVCYVSRGLVKDELKELVTEGAVRVRQQAEDPKDKGVDIQGEMLNLLHQEGGDLLYVFGDSRKPAQLQLGELIVVGPKVTVNQRDNTAEVNGPGGMSMPAGSTTFDGSRPSRPGSRVTIHWNKEMLFNGQYANFYGGVMAYQDSAYLKCQNLQVKLDREVSFKEGQKGGQSPKVDKLICELKVYVQDELRDANNKYIHHHRAEATQLEIDNLEGKTNASGPGKVYSLSRGGADPSSAMQGKSAALKTPEQPGQMMLTRIDYTGRLFSKLLQGDDRLSTFIDNIELFHAPADRPDAQFSPDRPPKDGFYLRCERLDVLTRKRDGKTTQLMQAQNRVLFRTQEFFGRADVIKYDEAQDQVIFEGNSGSPAILSKIAPSQGQENANIKATKILYNRKLGTFQLDGGKVISSW